MVCSAAFSYIFTNIFPIPDLKPVPPAELSTVGYIITNVSLKVSADAFCELDPADQFGM
jgi:hypothetical protein